MNDTMVALKWRRYKKRNQNVLAVRKKHFELENGVCLNTNLTIRLEDLQGPDAEVRLLLAFAKEHKRLAAYEKTWPRDEFSFQAYEEFLADFLIHPESRAQYRVPLTRKRKVM